MLGSSPGSLKPDSMNAGVAGIKRWSSWATRSTYPRFGFVPAHTRGLTCEFPVPPAVFMVLELEPSALAGVTGLVRYHPAFGAA